MNEEVEVDPEVEVDEEQTTDEESDHPEDAGDAEEGDAEDVEEPDEEVAVPVDSLASLRDRLAHLEERREHLRAQLAKSEVKERDLSEALEAMKSDLAEGNGSADEIADLEDRLGNRRKATGALREALGKVGTEEGEIGDRVGEIESRAEKHRQQKAARPLRAEADAAVEAFVANLVVLFEPLERRRRIAREVKEKFPLASAVLGVSLQTLLYRVGGALQKKHGVQDIGLAIEGYVRRILAGPLGTPWLPLPRIPADRLRELGIEE